MAKIKKSKAVAQKLAAKRRAKKINRKSSKRNRSANTAASKKCSNRTQVENQGFNSACRLLCAKNWRRYTDISNIIEVDGRIKALSTEGLVFRTKRLLVQLLPYKSGVQISRLSVWDDEQNLQAATRFVNTLVAYLIKNGITEIYSLPSEIANKKDNENSFFSELQLIGIYHKIGFAPEADSQYWKLLDLAPISFIQEYDETLLLSVEDPNLKYNPYYIVGNVEIYFEFTGNDAKNFMALIDLSSPAKAKEHIQNLRVNLLYGDSLNLLLNSLVNSFDSPNGNYDLVAISHFLQNTLGILLAMEAKSDKYQDTMKVLGYILASILHLLEGGFEKRVIKYRFVFDEKRETMDILSMKQGSGSQNRAA